MKRALVSIACLLLLPAAARAQAWEPFRKENGDVRRGTELLGKGDKEGALRAFDSAARALPNDPGAQLDRGLGLLANGKLPEAREAFRAAAQGQASPDLRGKAQYNMGLTFLSEADVAAKANQIEEAQKYTREALDAFKSSLRSAPQNHDAAWNLELAARRLVELKKKQEQQEQQKKNEQQQDQQNQDQQNQDSQGQQDQKQDQQKDQQGQEPKAQEGDKPQEPKQDQAQQAPGKDKENQPKPNEQGKQAEKPASPQQGQEAQSAQEGSRDEKALPEHMQKALDALSAGDDNLQKQQARMRAQQRPRRVEKDW